MVEQTNATIFVFNNVAFVALPLLVNKAS